MNPELFIRQIDDALRDIGLIKQQIDSGQYRQAKEGLKMVAIDMGIIERSIPLLPSETDVTIPLADRMRKARR